MNMTPTRITHAAASARLATATKVRAWDFSGEFAATVEDASKWLKVRGTTVTDFGTTFVVLADPGKSGLNLRFVVFA